MECDGMGYLALLLSSRLGIYLSSNNQPINESNQKSIYLPINQVYASVYLFSCCSTPIFHHLSTYPTSISFPTCLLSTGSISISLFLYLSIYLSIYLSVYLYLIYPSIHPSMLFMYLYICIRIMYVNINICIYIYGFFSQFYLSIHLCLSIHVCIDITILFFLSIFLNIFSSIYNLPGISMNWWTGEMDFVFNITTLGFVMGVKNIIRTSRKMPPRSRRTFLLDTWLRAFTTERFMGPRKPNP